MASSRLILTQLLFALVAAGCSESHGQDDDAGPPGVDASGPSLDASPWLDSGGSVDAGASIDGGFSIDAGGSFDAGPAGSCDAQDARSAVCPDVLCDGPPTWYWQGDRCVSIDCGACVGDDCGGGWSGEAACEAAHATCTASLCRSTGGDWRFWAEECEHYDCGFPTPVDCIVGVPVCNCGYNGRFVEGVGCVDPGCPSLEPPDPAGLCEGTGGTWGNTCCDSVCGQACPDPCGAPACTCGPLEIFDGHRGCQPATRCYDRRAGESCHAEARCEEGTICCDACGGPGCAGAPRCIAPVCDDDTDECGNDPFAP